MVKKDKMYVNISNCQKKCLLLEKLKVDQTFIFWKKYFISSFLMVKKRGSPPKYNPFYIKDREKRIESGAYKRLRLSRYCFDCTLCKLTCFYPLM